jgi:hypothetical protein
MNTFQFRFGITALLFFLIFFTGFWLSRTGKPYGSLLFSIHKFMALGFLIFLGITVYKNSAIYPLNPIQLILVCVTVICFLSTIITGGLQSIDQAMPPLVLRLHQFMPYLALLFTAVSLYLIQVMSGLTGSR